MIAKRLLPRRAVIVGATTRTWHLRPNWRSAATKQSIRTDNSPAGGLRFVGVGVAIAIASILSCLGRA